MAARKGKGKVTPRGVGTRALRLQVMMRGR